MARDNSFLVTRNSQITSHIATRAGRNCQLFRRCLSVVNRPPQPSFPAPDAGQKKFNSRPVAPTLDVVKFKATDPTPCRRHIKPIAFSESRLVPHSARGEDTHHLGGEEVVRKAHLDPTDRIQTFDLFGKHDLI